MLKLRGHSKAFRLWLRPHSGAKRQNSIKWRNISELLFSVLYLTFLYCRVLEYKHTIGSSAVNLWPEVLTFDLRLSCIEFFNYKLKDSIILIWLNATQNLFTFLETARNVHLCFFFFLRERRKRKCKPRYVVLAVSSGQDEGCVMTPDLV